MARSFPASCTVLFPVQPGRRAELDAPRGRTGFWRRTADQLRDAEISVHGYEVISLKPTQHGYYEEVRRLIERVEQEMDTVTTNPWPSAFSATVKEVDQDIPF